MSIISVASGNSCYRGLEYYKQHTVKKLKRISSCEFSSVVSGSEDYKVYLNLEHVRQSTCNCPLAKDKRIICKHIVATYFEAVPGSAKEFEEEQKRLEEEYEDEQEKEYENAVKYLHKMSKKDLIEEIIYMFDYGPEWLYDDFIRRNDI